MINEFQISVFWVFSFILNNFPFFRHTNFTYLCPKEDIGNDSISLRVSDLTKKKHIQRRQTADDGMRFSKISVFSLPLMLMLLIVIKMRLSDLKFIAQVDFAFAFAFEPRHNRRWRDEPTTSQALRHFINCGALYNQCWPFLEEIVGKFRDQTDTTRRRSEASFLALSELMTVN